MGSCGNPDKGIGESVTTGSVAGTGSSTGSNAVGAPVSVGTNGTGGTNTAGGVTTGGNSTSVPGAGGAPNVGGTTTTGPTTPGSTSTMGSSSSSTGGPGAGGTSSTSTAEPCVDVEPPPDPEWPDATCATWANETEECSAEWFADYCNASCGRCVPTGGTPSTGGTGNVPEPEPCVDVEPPPDPEWPDATCATWATETEECSAEWFADYCDVSCGRCVPEGGNGGSGGMSNMPVEPEKCEDVEPPPDPEWPGATCAEWSSESDACAEEWFAEYCDVSCGRCVPEGGVPEKPGAPDCSGEGLPSVTGGDGYATRYWDCCQPHCSQFDGHRCGQDGVSGAGDQNSACNGGGSFACYDEAPHAVSECLSYGHIAKSNPNCGACYRIQFTGQGQYNDNDPGSKLIAGKQMVVKVTNTGGDVAGNQFDLMVPGGGVGQFNACSRQWGANDLGAQYGGFLTNCTGSHAEKKECVRKECEKIPSGPARDGCIWFVDWFQVADNPKFTSQQTDCPF